MDTSSTKLSPSSASGLLRRFFHRPAFYALLFIALVECSIFLGTPPLFNSDSYFRNPYFRRGWPGYLAATAPARPDEIRVLVISNSQGYGREVAPDQIYCALLAQELQKLFPSKRLRVVNWSVPPCRGPEALVLLAHARRLNPQLTLCILGPGSFTERYYHLPPENRQLRRLLTRSKTGRRLRRNKFWRNIIYGQPHPTPLSMFLSDVGDAAWPGRRELPASFSDHYFVFTTRLRAWLDWALPSFPVRDWPTAWFSRENLWLRRFIHEREFQTWFAPRYKASDFIELGEEAEWLQRKAYLPLVDLMMETARPLPGGKIFVNQPLQGAQSADAETTDFVKTLAKGGWEYRDMRSALPAEAFFPRGTHFTIEGHHQFALLLARLAAPLLPEGVQKQ